MDLSRIVMRRQVKGRKKKNIIKVKGMMAGARGKVIEEG